MKKMFLLSILMILATISCKNNQSDKVLSTNKNRFAVPQWSKEAIWYQIFVERFRNGDTTNDPTRADLFRMNDNPAPPDWKITPWGHDWYQPDDWFANLTETKFNDRLQYRRYGGDLQGVLDKLDYIAKLGINAIYFNPLNDAPSLHKYDPRCWHHIDRNFGPDPEKDKEMMATENPADPQTWKFTSADSLFLHVIDCCHQLGIKVIMDYSWNHTGYDFWALNDVREKGARSEFAGWYDIKSYDDPSTPADEFKYKGWVGIKYLPEIRKAIVGQDTLFPYQGNFASQEAKNHIFSVAKRWLDPNGDGKTNDGVDGFRLDVAAEVPMGFWPEFRKVVRNINLEAYLVGEVWWLRWPNDLMNPRPFLNDSIFDAIMNYRWYRVARQFFAQAPTTMLPSVFADSLNRLLSGIDTSNIQAMMNLTSSHDSPRTSTDLYNAGGYKYLAKPYDDEHYKIDKPTDDVWKVQKMLLVHQFTFIGAPHIWYGDEVGMWGADDPDTRKPMVWNDIKYDDEKTHPFLNRTTVDKVCADTARLYFYQKMIRIRKENKALSLGDFRVLIANNEKGILAYERNWQGKKAIVVFNCSNRDQEINLSIGNNIQVKNLLNRNLKYLINKHQLLFSLDGQSCDILICNE